MAPPVESKIGTMLPCTVIVHDTNEGQFEVSAIDSVASMLAAEDNDLKNIPGVIRNKLKTVTDSL